jgi:alkanesulfonate monooxygenase SsuD/methylene tetrahydromethanopterin reductase-like flavin-dependent oxidoreductase (luciferase family)
LVKGLTTDQLTYKGPHYEYQNVPIAIRPLQQPHPPFWYGSSGAEGSAWAGEEGLHFVTLGPNPAAKENIDTFKAAFAKRGNKAAQPKSEFPGGIAIGVQRHIFVDETDEKAHAWARPAMNKHLEHINWIRNKHGVTATAARMRNTRGANYDECLEEGTVIAGSPKTVLAGIERHAREIGFNYLLTYLFLGNMPFDTAMRSFKLFTAEVMPAVEKM